MSGMKQHYHEWLIISAVRYALGRMTYVVGMTVDEAIRVWPHLHDGTKIVIEKDVRAAVADGVLGMECDAADWQRLLAHIECNRKALVS